MPSLSNDPATLVAAFRKHTADEWLEVLWANDVAVHPSDPPGEVLRSEQARVNDYLTDLDHPELGRITQAGTPFEVAPASRVRGPAPKLGQHQAEVLDAARRAPRRDFASSSSGTPALPLAGVRVVDFGNYLAGPFAPMLMADLGAEVIKLEATRGDAMRPVARSFCGCQRGKRSIALDLKNPEVRPVLEELVRRADIVHHNLRYPAARKLRIDYDSLHELNPDLVYCHHQQLRAAPGERKDWPGYDPALSGVARDGRWPAADRATRPSGTAWA